VRRRPSVLKSIAVAGMVIGLSIAAGMLVLMGIFVLLLHGHPVEI
jgi:hypothetical protein